MCGFFVFFFCIRLFDSFVCYPRRVCVRNFAHARHTELFKKMKKKVGKVVVTSGNDDQVGMQQQSKQTFDCTRRVNNKRKEKRRRREREKSVLLLYYHNKLFGCPLSIPKCVWLVRVLHAVLTVRRNDRKNIIYLFLYLFRGKSL